MKTKPIVLVDGNHFGIWATAASRVPKGHFAENMRSIIKTIPGRVIVLWDGISWRHAKFPAYKRNRVANAELVRLKECWKAERPDVVRMLDVLGISQMKADNYEADDLAALMCRKTLQAGVKVSLLTADRDWAQLYEPDRVRWIDIKSAKRIQDNEMFEIITGFKNTGQFVEGKALCGDSGDNIPSVGDFGPKTAKELFETFGNVRGAINAQLLDPEKIVYASKRLRSFCDDLDKQAKFERNLTLVDLNSPAVPEPENFRVIKSSFDREKFQAFNARHLLTSHRDELEWSREFMEYSNV